MSELLYTETAARIQGHMKMIETLYPEAWKNITLMRSVKGAPGLPDWPAWCYVPMAGAYAMVSPQGRMQPGDPRTLHVPMVAAMAAWRQTRGIYHYHPEIYPEILKTAVDDSVPVEAVLRLPEWCCYVLCDPPIILDQATIQGFFAHLDHDNQAGYPQLRLLLDTSKGLSATYLYLVAPSFNACVANSKAYTERLMIGQNFPPEAVEQIVQHETLMAQITVQLLPLVLYLCARNADFRAVKGERDRPHNPQPTKTKKGAKLFAATADTCWEAGHAAAAAMREAKASGADPAAAQTYQGYWSVLAADTGAEHKKPGQLFWRHPLLGGA